MSSKAALSVEEADEKADKEKPRLYLIENRVSLEIYRVSRDYTPIVITKI